MSAVLIDFATPEVVRPLPLPAGPISHRVRSEIRSAWHRGWAMVLAAKYERDAAWLRVRRTGQREPPDLVILKRRLIAAEDAYDDARVALMTTTAFEKAGVRWKWKQMEDLIERRSEWEHALAADEARFDMGDDRPEIKPPAATDKAGPAPTTAAVLDQIGRILMEMRAAIQPGGPLDS